jgi:MOSC domain-containing protein YiiM
MAPGELAWIGLRPARRASMIPVSAAKLAPGQGLEGDHYISSRNGPRQVTLIAAEDLGAIGQFLAGAGAQPEQLRRNLVTRGVNLLALKDRRFSIGAVILEGAGECAPCGRMEETLGPGGYNAVRGHGGILARVIEGGEVRLGDPIERVEEDISTVLARRRNP